jgi:hypothetical protein
MTNDGLIELRERVSQADTIVSGTVTGIEAVDRTSDAPVSHHEPLWIAIKLRVDSVLKGDVMGDSIVAELARSPDPRIDSGLRPEIGQQGVWLLHPDAEGRDTLASPMDYQPLEAAHRVTEVLQG